MREGEIALGGGPEFDTIRRLLARWGDRAIGVGDDAAVLQLPRGDALIASNDAFVEGHHFRPNWLSSREIGYRAITAALSDLAAMAAQPLGVLINIGLPERWTAALDDIADGIGEAVETASTHIVGGNLSGASELSLTTTVLGNAFKPLRRTRLRPGDVLYVTGKLGGPAAAIAAWERGEEPESEHRRRFAHPVARLREARWLVDRGATAGIDISDGVGADLEHLVLASHVGADVDLALLPLIGGVDDSLQAAASGEEYELLVGAPDALNTVEFEQRFGLPLTPIGRVRAPEQGIVFRLGTERVAKPFGYDHLSR